MSARKTTLRLVNAVSPLLLLVLWPVTGIGAAPADSARAKTTAGRPEAEDNAAKQSGPELTLSNRKVQVEVDPGGLLSVVDRVSGRRWGPDPWDRSAGLIEIVDNGKARWWDLSKVCRVRIESAGPDAARIEFDSAGHPSGPPEFGLVVHLSLKDDTFTLRLDSATVAPGCTVRRLLYPLRAFSLRTDVDRGAAVIPFWCGAVIPSYIFPMNGGKFCMWDDAVHGPSAIGELYYYSWSGLTMPFFGIHDDRSALLAVLPYDGSVGVQWVANYNRHEKNIAQGKPVGADPRILAVTPAWRFTAPAAATAPAGSVAERPQVTYHVLPGGNHVTIARRYRQVADAAGLLVTLKEKAEKNPNVKKLAGALYVGIYGGYPHYVNLPGMAFTFDQLDGMVRDMHDKLGLQHALVHAWGTFSNYAPVMWPISEELGGQERLKQVVDRVKGYGWLYTSYHSFVSLLDHDPQFNLKLAPRDAQGRPEVHGRWKAVDPKRWVDLAKATLPKEIEALGQNADITDIAFTGEVDADGRRLADYLASTGLVLGTERGNEWLVPQYHMFEGLVVAFRPHPLSYYSHPAPLFNLVYHDAIVNYGKIQDPNQLAHAFSGDYYVKTLRALLHGDGPMLFIAPYEYSGVRPYVKFAAEVLCPVHRRIAFERLEDHAYLSPDFLVQRTHFGGGVEVTVNLGPTPYQGPGVDEVLPGYGFRVHLPDGPPLSGNFSHHVHYDGKQFDFQAEPYDGPAATDVGRP